MRIKNQEILNFYRVMMHWKEQLRVLEQHKEWDFAINFMEKTIADNPYDKDAYIYTNYLLMNLLVEEEYPHEKHDYYAQLARKYFDESYAKFSQDPEYLFYTGITAVMSEWYFGIEREDYVAMLQKAMELDPNNPLYKRTHYISLDLKNHNQQQEAMRYARLVQQQDSPIKKLLLQKGSVGKYLLELMINDSQDVLDGKL